MENTEKKEVLDEARIFLNEVKALINEAIKINKKIEYKSDDLVILSLKDDLHGVFEVYNVNDRFLIPKLVYIGNKDLRKSYLLNLIHKEENSLLLKERNT